MCRAFVSDKHADSAEGKACSWSRMLSDLDLSVPLSCLHSVTTGADNTQPAPHLYKPLQF